MHYLVIEDFKDASAIYKRLDEKGRMMPEGLNYISSWIDHHLKNCWQIMETDDFVLLERWIDNWKDLMDFKVGGSSRANERTLRWPTKQNRSEEHTSELQSHSFISYAVFC